MGSAWAAIGAPRGALTDFGKHAVLESGVGKAGQSIVVASGYPFDSSGSTNTMRVEML